MVDCPLGAIQSSLKIAKAGIGNKTPTNTGRSSKSENVLTIHPLK
jgi:hypothetical protein